MSDFMVRPVAEGEQRACHTVLAQALHFPPTATTLARSGTRRLNGAASKIALLLHPIRIAHGALPRA